MALKKEYMSVNGQVMAERDSSGWEVYTRDALGSVSAIFDAGGNLAATYVTCIVACYSFNDGYDLSACLEKF